jgi:hypothetical protein
VFPSRGLGRFSSRTDPRHRGCGQPSWTFVTLRRFHRCTRSWLISGFANRLLQPRSSRTLLLQSFLAPPCSCTLSNAIAIRPWAYVVLQGFHRKNAAVLRRLATDSARPLSWGFAPSSGHERKGSGFFPRTPTSSAVASSGFEPSRRLDPLHAFPTFLPGPLLGLLPSGLFSSRRSRPSFEGPYPLGIA